MLITVKTSIYVYFLMKAIILFSHHFYNAYFIINYKTKLKESIRKQDVCYVPGIPELRRWRLEDSKFWVILETQGEP